MNLESNYGSSEYSQEAEELFARYLLELEAGTAAEFDDFCAEHDEHADELYGLHADWDNVRGLLSRLEERRPKRQADELVQAPLAAPAPAPAPEPTAMKTPGVETPEFVARETKRPLAAVGLVAALGLGIWSWSLLNEREVLAEQKYELVKQSERVEAELIATRENSDELARAKSQLERDLGSTQEERDDARKQFQGLSQDLNDERQAQLELTEQRRKLEQELEAERLRQTQAAERLQLAEARAQVLAAQLTAEELKSREAQLWPTANAVASDLREWLADAEALSAQIDAPLSVLKSAQTGDADLSVGETLRGLETTLSFLRGETGLTARCRKRLGQIETWQMRLAEEDAHAWQATLERIQDAQLSPRLAGLEWEPQLGLVPLGEDPASGLLRFADWQTGEIPAQDESGELLLDDASALVFVLVPGIELEGQVAPAFLVSLNEWTPARRGLALQRAVALNAEVSDDKRFQLDLEQLGFIAISSLHIRLAQSAGVRAQNWSRHPVRPLRLE